MKKLCLALIACATLGTTFNAMADSNHTVSMGYAQSKIEDAMNIKGINMKYRFEWDSPVSFITSLTYMGASEQFSNQQFNYKHINDVKFKYYSLSVGPVYRFNEFISIYGLVGANLNRLTSDNYTLKSNSVVKRDRTQGTTKKTSLMYGAGIQFNPRQDISLDIGYEGSSWKEPNDKSLSINGINVGVGYRF